MQLSARLTAHCGAPWASRKPSPASASIDDGESDQSPNFDDIAHRFTDRRPTDHETNDDRDDADGDDEQQRDDRQRPAKAVAGFSKTAPPATPGLYASPSSTRDLIYLRWTRRGQQPTSPGQSGFIPGAFSEVAILAHDLEIAQIVSNLKCRILEIPARLDSIDLAANDAVRPSERPQHWQRPSEATSA